MDMDFWDVGNIHISIWVVYTYIYNEDEFTLLYVWLNKIKT